MKQKFDIIESTCVPLPLESEPDHPGPLPEGHHA